MPDMARFIAFDVETPNHNNDRISALGVTVVEGGRITRSFATLVNPECRFEPFHMALTGITPDRVADSPTFPQLWRQIAPLMGSGVLVAHNAPFDLAVLGRCLGAAGIRWRQRVPYLCTCRMSRRLLPALPNHKLDTLCRHLGIALEHHRADSDSCACAEILLYHLRAGAQLAPFLRTYDLTALRTIR